MEPCNRNGRCFRHQAEYPEHCMAFTCSPCPDGCNGGSKFNFVRCGYAVIYKKSPGKSLCTWYFFRGDFRGNAGNCNRIPVLPWVLCSRRRCVSGSYGGDPDRILYGKKRKRSGTDQTGIGRYCDSGNVYCVFQLYCL